MSAIDDSQRVPEAIRTCPCCGLAQVVPSLAPRTRAHCARCDATLAQPAARVRSASRTAAVASAALVLYPFAMLMPIMTIEQMGYTSEASVLDGTATLFAGGHYFVGVIVFLCSVVLPVGKLLGLLAISLAGLRMRDRHRARTHRFVELTGRWGMLDVLAVALLVAVVKLGTSVELTVGPGAAAFTGVVVLSLIASAVYDPHAFWDDGQSTTTTEGTEHG